MKNQLKLLLKNASKIAILGIGSLLRADDAAGMLVAQEIKKRRRQKKPIVKVFLGETAPENLTGEIKKFKPTHLIIIDSGDTGQKPGAVTIINPEEETGVSFSTHQLPTGILIDYLKKFIQVKVIVIVIQPKDLTFNHCVSKEVSSAVHSLSSSLLSCL